MAANDDLLKDVKKFFSDKVDAYGATYQGADYGNADRQTICFDQLTKILPVPGQAFSINDYGCGYGALIDYLSQRGHHFTYTGFDISESMIRHAREQYESQEHTAFLTDESQLAPADYTIAGGIFNIKFDAEYDTWTQMILQTLTRMWSLSTRAMSFNILTKYSDADKMRDDLYYADPCFLFDYCKRNFSKEVALLHDYGVYEFTILVRRSAAWQ